MEDISQGSRRLRPPHRPESSASSHTKMTPSSSNSSSANLPQRLQSSRGSTGGASLLQERLRDRKVESARHSRRRSVDMSFDDRGVQSSPVKGSFREERRPSSTGISSKGMGVKQIEEQVSTLHKQNFDLKLELYHRRQRQEALEARVEAAEKQIAEQAELQEINEQLLAELEKRDQAVEEAVGIIVSLEDKVEKLLQDQKNVRAFDADYDSRYFRQSHNETSSSPPEYEQQRPMKRVSRMPSFLSEQSEGTEALRSLYLPHNKSYSDATLEKLDEEDGMSSPRLSVLSESSFLSVYGDKTLQLPAEEDTPIRRHRASSSIEKWVDDRAPSQTPVRPSPPALRKNQYLSINDVLESPLQRLEKLKNTLEKHNGSKLSAQPTRNEIRKPLRHMVTDQPFEQHGLPPTPDTISTNTLRHYHGSNDTMAENNIRGGTSLNSTSTFPVPLAAHHSYQSTLSVRPRSAGETVTSRRDGHGWDTETQDDLTTDAGSIYSSGSVYAEQNRARRAMTPNLFTSFGNDSWVRDAGRGAGREMFNPTAFHLPSQTASRYSRLRRSSTVNNPQSDDTMMPAKYEGPQYGNSPVNTSPRPELPDRRSSLAALTKLRKSQASVSTPPVTASPTSKEKKSRLSSLRIFGRGDTPSAPATPIEQAPPQTALLTKGNRMSQQYSEPNGYADEEEARATPPPIKRSRGQSVQGTYRPVSADSPGRDSLDARQEPQGRLRGGSVNASNVDVGEDSKSAPGGRKWFALGRTNSLRRS